MGKLIIFSAPSGSGKTTIVKRILEEFSDLEFSISATSREKRGTEEDTVDYYFLSATEFKQKRNDDDFVEWEEVYDNQYYGTLKSEVERLWAKKKHVVSDVHVLGGLNIKKIYGKNALAIFIKAPSLVELENRLRLRNTDSEASIQKRINKATEELSFSAQFDAIIVNDDLELAVEHTIILIKEFLELN